MLQSIEKTVVSKIYGHGEGWAFTKTDFVPEFEEANIHQALSNLNKAGKIRRVYQGVYDYPRYSNILGRRVGPDIRQVVRALARKFNWRVQPDGNTALNFLGLCTQVPVRWDFLSDGPSRKYIISGQTLTFKNAALKDVGFKYKESGVVVQALKALGRQHVNQMTIERIRCRLDPSAYGRILEDTRTATGWIYEVIKRICEDTD